MLPGSAASDFSGEVIERSLNHVSGKFGGIAGVYQRHHYESERRTALAAWGRHVEALVTGQAAENVVDLKGRTMTAGAEDVLNLLARPRFENLVSGLDRWCKNALADFDGKAIPAKHFRGRTKYAQTIWKYLAAARDGIERGDAERAAIYGLKLGLMIREYQLIGAARLGRNKSRKDGSKGGRPRAKTP